jgi:microcystin-dependent protein
MAYIGNGRTLMIFGSNVRDDLIPDGIKKEFILSQEVPGGYEGNVWVLRKKLNGTQEDSFWEVLEPEADYTISGIGDNYNKKITLAEAPSTDDKVYVIHKGDATYNFVPSPKSVGPEQLSENLRDFKTDNFVGDGSEVEFQLTREVSSKNSILVTIDGIVKSPDEDFSLSTDTLPKITFNTAPSSDSKIRVLYLSFSTISRRANFAPGQEPQEIAPNSIFTDAIQTDAVTKEKIADDSIDGARILLDNNQSIRSKDSNGSTQDILKISSDNNTTLVSPNNLDIIIDTNKKISFQSTEILPETTNEISIGSTSKKFKDINVAGNINVDGNVDGVDISALKTIVDTLKAQIDDGSLGLSILPVGTILMYSSENVPTNFMKCDGSAISRNEYTSLFSLISTTFGSGNGTTTFNLPDLRSRVPVGSNSNIATSDGLGIANRSLTHSHIAPSHSHTIPQHTHIIPGHHHTYALGSDLNITSSGSHTTSIDISHSHTGSIGNNTTGILISSAQSNIALNDPGHNHLGSTSQNITSLAHTHTNSLIINDNTTLQFFIRASESINGTESGINRFNEATAVSADGTGTSPRVRKTSIENHNHTASLTINNSDALNHSHTIPNGVTGISLLDPTHNHSITDNGHGHTLIINSLPSTTKTDTSGVHIHPASSFSGRIGKVTNGSDGNSDLTTSQSGSLNTGDSGNSATSTNTIPHMSINFIIKVK